MQPMAARLGVDHQHLQQFLTSSTWDVTGVRRRVATSAVGVVSPTVWVVDDTGFAKDGPAWAAPAAAADTKPYLSVDYRALDGATVNSPFTATLQNADAVTGTITWLLDDHYVGKSAAAPYTWSVSTTDGAHKLKARWTDTDWVTAEFTVVPEGWAPPKQVYEEPGPALKSLWVSADNRRKPVSGLYDWSKAGFGGGTILPTDANVRTETACRISADDLRTKFGVKPNDGADDTGGLQAAVDQVKAQCSPTGDYTKESRILLPACTLNVSHELHLDADYLILRGAGSDPATGTHLVYAPDANTRYDTITKDGSRWDEDAMTSGEATGGWLWPGRGLFRVQTRAVADKYAAQYAAAPANRKDLFEGTVNDRWTNGLTLRGKPGDANYAGRKGDKTVYLAANSPFDNLKVGGLVNVMAANSQKFYEQMKAVPSDYDLENLHMRQQVFMVTSGDPLNATITLDKPLEYDLPINSTSDGSAPINGEVFPSKVTPLVDAVASTRPRPTSPARPGPPAQRRHADPPGLRIRDRRCHRLAIRSRSHRPARRHRRRPGRRNGPDPAAGLHDPRRHSHRHRPGRRSEALLLRQTPPSRRQCAGHRGPGRPAGLGISSLARLNPRPDRRSRPRQHRHVDQ